MKHNSHTRKPSAAKGSTLAEPWTDYLIDRARFQCRIAGSGELSPYQKLVAIICANFTNKDVYTSTGQLRVRPSRKRLALILNPALKPNRRGEINTDSVGHAFKALCKLGYMRPVGDPSKGRTTNEYELLFRPQDDHLDAGLGLKPDTATTVGCNGGSNGGQPPLDSTATTVTGERNHRQAQRVETYKPSKVEVGATLRPTGGGELAPRPEAVANTWSLIKQDAKLGELASLSGRKLYRDDRYNGTFYDLDEAIPGKHKLLAPLLLITHRLDEAAAIARRAITASMQDGSKHAAHLVVAHVVAALGPDLSDAKVVKELRSKLAEALSMDA